MFRGSARGALVGPVTYNVGNSPIAIITADVNNDGRSDIVVANYLGASVSTLLCQADGTFQPAIASSVFPNQWSGLPRALATGDFNGDGRLDLAVTLAQSGYLSILPGHGDGSFGPPAMVQAPAATSVVAADFNGDNAIDLALGSSDGVFILQGIGNGAFRFSSFDRASARLLAPVGLRVTSRPDLVTLGYAGSIIPNASATADFDGDGQPATDADLEAFFRCLAGTCCATCDPRGADFDGDDDTGTDADIEAFFRVIAGGSC